MVTTSSIRRFENNSEHKIPTKHQVLSDFKIGTLSPGDQKMQKNIKMSQIL